MSRRSDLGKARGYGSAHEGAHHWWMQRVTAIGLLVLLPWFIYAAFTLSGLSYTASILWLQKPWNTIAMVLFVGVAFYHARLGAQVVIEDYISHQGVRLAALILNKFGLLILGIICVYSLLKITL